MENEHLAAVIRQSIQSYAHETAMRYQKAGQWQDISYQTLGETVDTLARALLVHGVQPGDRIGIFAENRPEWALVDFAILSIRAVSVPIYATNTKHQAAYIIEETAMNLIFTGGQEHYNKIQAILDRAPHLQTIIAFDEDTQLTGDKSLHFSQFLQQGADHAADAEIAARLAAADRHELATIIYTSGTTGEPKGVMLTHANFYHQFKAMDGQFQVGPGDRSLCFLPLTHVYERSWSYFIFKTGATNYYLANPKAVIETMQEMRPTVMVSVPRLYEKIYAAAYAGLEHGSAMKQKLFHWSIDIGQTYQYRRKDKRPIGLWLNVQHSLADRLVLSKIRDVVGGSKNFFSAGGAPLARPIEEFFFAAGLLVCEGYGLTETSPMVTFNTPNAFKFGTVGKPIPDCQVTFGPDGEILVKSPSVTQGYYNKPEATAEAFVDGWFRTGDVGEFDEEGFLRITDRIKDLIITSGGKNIAPQRIETAVAKDHYIEQFIAIGDRRKFISALVVPNFAALEEYARVNGIAYTAVTDLIQHPDIIAFYRSRIDAVSQDLANYERVKAFTLLPAPFTQETGELTPTQKIKRKVVTDKYAALIEAMYPAD
ncbi:MAG: long-chain fatty acid--CoA ligase [Chloroflexi bacterium]|nr:long-chain fatty acid--CoA ligase [Chloroflexota bacterium]MBK6712549.1 long-chain fatty acid--CoA ligase [Chloroflexota bacterium]MBK7178260.1 long-chain fatty acid--CoA ligase [Chloroflexota bacterium]MBK8933748.1 long-chain fatty acid--CoA ligase [Chloroflexota bacterium]